MTAPLPPPINLSRRTLFRGAGALVLAFQVPVLACRPAAAGSSLVPVSAWLKISSDSVTVVSACTELGQGISTALAMLVAEELDIDWQTVSVEAAPLDAAFVNPMLKAQRTADSTSIRGFYVPARQAGAAARLMLLAAAARVWRVPVGELTAARGVVSHAASSRQASYGALAQVASHQKVPVAPVLRDRKHWTLIGTSVPRLDLPAKVLGQAVYGGDIRLPGMLHAAIRHCPVFGGSLNRIDDSAIRTNTPSGYPPGVVAVVPLRYAVAVVANSWWQARSALAQLTIAWNEGEHANNTSAAIATALSQAVDTRDARVIAQGASRGDVDAAFKGAVRTVEAVYRLPLLAHTPLEPLTATASVTANGCELWVSTQNPGYLAKTLPEVLGIPPEQVRVYTTAVGGSFGRRLETDFAVEAVHIAKAVGKPVQLIWTREEDVRHDYYRPASAARVAIGLDSRGRPVVWRHRVAAPSVLARVRPGALREGVDAIAIDGVADMPYQMPALRLEYVRQEIGVPVGFWRSSGRGSNAFAVEGMIDEAAAAAGRDPYRYRRDLLGDSPRALAVLDLAAAKAGWGQPLAAINGARRGRGIALHQGFGSACAQVVEVSVFNDGRLRVDRVVAALDCGITIHPDSVVSQITGSIVLALSAALYGKITVDRGRAVQSNFHDVKTLTLAQTPPVEVHRIDSEAEPGGVGETGVPPLAPALINAIYAATGRRLRALPVADHDLRSV